MAKKSGIKIPRVRSYTVKGDPNSTYSRDRRAAIVEAMRQRINSKLKSA